ncbi:MAG: antibiotic biosynthesis monooxygenase [Verrucomicrobiales bacterium]|nr:antibiotic biosynthesis monooxygenase [Verrucomicrobiales bacterium]
MIHVVATIEVVEGKRDAFLREFHKLVPQVYAEPGCHEYAPFEDVETDIPAQGGARKDVVTVLEKWKDVASLKAHLDAQHMAEFRERVKDLVSEVKLQILKQG